MHELQDFDTSILKTFCGSKILAPMKDASPKQKADQQGRFISSPIAHGRNNRIADRFRYILQNRLGINEQ